MRYELRIYDIRLGKNEVEKVVRELATLLDKKRHINYVLERLDEVRIASKLTCRNPTTTIHKKG